MSISKTTNEAAIRVRSSEGRVEHTVVNLVCAWIVLLPWLLGGRLWWAQVLGVAVGAVALIVALSREENRRALLRFPVFWLGLIFLLVVLCQSLNPWIQAIRRPIDYAKVWDVYLVPHISWLPAGVRADFFEMNTWLMFAYWLAPWLLVCAWWAAVRRRGSARQLGWAVFINGVITAVVVLVEGIHPPDKVLGFYSEIDLVMNREVGAGFVYRNAAATFLYLSMAVGFAQACWLHKQARDEGRDAGASWMVLLGCLVILASFFVLGSRAGLAIAAAIFVCGLVVLLGSSLFSGKRSPGLWIGALVLLLSAGGLVAYEVKGGSSWTMIRWAYRISHPEDDVRADLRRVTVHMIKDYPWLGQGGGSYRYVSPAYFYADSLFLSKTAPGGLGLRANQAHSDWLQLPMEYGFIGASPLLLILLYFYGSIIRYLRYVSAAGWIILIATVAMLIHAAVDFPAYNAPVLTLFSLLLASTVKMAVLEMRRSKA